MPLALTSIALPEQFHADDGHGGEEGGALCSDDGYPPGVDGGTASQTSASSARGEDNEATRED